MRSRYFVLALLIGLGLALLDSLPTPAGESANAAKIDKLYIDKLIEQMGSGTFSEREKATKELKAIGMPALVALRKAAKSDDAEVRKRAEELVQTLEKQAESAAILAPKRVHLVYKDTPVHEAIADFQKKSGYTIYLHDPQGKLKERRITLDTGETTFWHAFGLFCDKAGLTEATRQEVMQGAVNGPNAGPGRAVPPGAIKPPVRRLPPQPAPGTLPATPAVPPAKGVELATQNPAAPAIKPLPPQPARPIAAAGGVVAARMPILSGNAGVILLKEGKPKKLPTDDRSAVRVRALPKADMFGTAPEGEVILALEVTPEPKLQWQGLQSIRINKAVDNQNQKLAQVRPQVPAAPGANGAGGFAPGGAPVPNLRPAIARPIRFWGGDIAQQVPVQLKKGEKAAKSLKELTGVISANLLSEAKPMITVDNLAKAAGKTFKGKDGGSIKVVSVKTEEGKKTTIQFELEQPPNTIPAAAQNGAVGGAIWQPLPPVKVRPLPPAPGAPPGAAPGAPAAQAPAGRVQVIQQQAQIQIQIGNAQGRVIAIGGAGFAGPFNGVSVQDDKGNTLPIQMGPQQVRIMAGPGGANIAVLTYTFICQPGKDQGQAAKLVYSGRKNVTVDIPFTLKDVPLP